MSHAIRSTAYATLLLRLQSFARRLSVRHGDDCAAAVLARHGAELPFPQLCSHVRSATYRANRAERRRANHENEYARIRGVVSTDTTDADTVAPIDYLSMIADAQTREVIRRSIDGETQSEIASALGVSQPTVARRFAAGIETIREQIGMA